MKFFSIIISLLALAIGFLYLFVQYIYAGKYVQTSSATATTGIIFKETLNLKEFRNVSSGNDIWGKYTCYTRSDRHSEVTIVYCNKFCTK